ALMGVIFSLSRAKIPVPTSPLSNPGARMHPRPRPEDCPTSRSFNRYGGEDMQLWPWVTKVCCKYAAGAPLAGSQPPQIVPTWAVHPSLKTALDSLQSYDCWVARVVMPIAFQWIEEHKDEVYKLVPTKPKDLTDDIGVVIAAAFTLVEQTPCYKEERSLWHSLYEHQSTKFVAPTCVLSGAEV